jgi:hypothetical protein
MVNRDHAALRVAAFKMLDAREHGMNNGLGTGRLSPNFGLGTQTEAKSDLPGNWHIHLCCFDATAGLRVQGRLPPL